MNSQVKRKVKALCDETPWNRGDINSICFEETILEAGKYSETEIRIQKIFQCALCGQNGWKLLKTIKRSEIVDSKKIRKVFKPYFDNASSNKRDPKNEETLQFSYEGSVR